MLSFLTGGGTTVLVVSSLVYLKYLQKEGMFIILITKQESLELQKLGHRFGSEGSLHHTYSRKCKKYYLTESRKAMADLEMIRTSRIVEK